MKICDEENKENKTANLVEENKFSTDTIVALTGTKEKHEETAIDSEIETTAETHFSLAHPPTITPPRSPTPPTHEQVTSAPPTNTLPQTTSLTITAQSNTPCLTQPAVPNLTIFTKPECGNVIFNVMTDPFSISCCSIASRELFSTSLSKITHDSSKTLKKDLPYDIENILGLKQSASYVYTHYS